MDEEQAFRDGYIQGWQSIAGPRFQLLEIPAPSAGTSGTKFMQGLMQGIAAAKQQMSELSQV